MVIQRPGAGFAKELFQDTKDFLSSVDGELHMPYLFGKP